VWQSKVTRRTRALKALECPYCSGFYASETHNLLLSNPELSAEWHPTKNEELKSFDVTPKSSKIVWWQCTKGHEWEAKILNRANGNGCPYCAGQKVSSENSLKFIYPKIANEWHPTKNGELKPDQVTKASAKKVWWICSNGHEWNTSIKKRTISNTGCSKCRKNL